MQNHFQPQSCYLCRMLNLFEKHLDSHLPYLLGKKLLVAVSGGIDSMVLVDLLLQLSQSVALAHANFKLRETDSDADQFFIENYAKTNKISCFVKQFDTKSFAETDKLSIQEAARKLRYEWFDELLNTHRFDYLLTAHHLDDSLETFLIHLSRGTGIDGLLGIPEKNGKILRPMLVFSKDEIASYANSQYLSWREDNSNQSDKYLRNRIRHHVVPELKKLNKDFLGNFQNTLTQLQFSAVYIKNQVEEFRSLHFLNKTDGIEISTDSLWRQIPLESTLYELFKAYQFTDWKALRDLLNAQSGKQLFSSTHRLIKDRDKLILTELNSDNKNFIFRIEENIQEVLHPIHLKIAASKQILKGNTNEIYVDKNSLKFPLSLQKWQQGDYFYPIGMKGKKKISKFFKDEKMSLLEKENIWVLTSENQIVWIIGKRADRRFLATENTKNIIRITYLPISILQQ